jgi:hypothetical protein
VDAAARWRLGGIGSLLAWRCIDLPETPGAVLMATTEDVVLASLRTFDVLWSLCEDGHGGATSCGGGGPAIRDACWGLVSTSRPSLRNLFVVVLTDGELSVHFIKSRKKTVLAAGVPGLVGCGDLDGDRRDDIVLVDPTSASLRVFLGGGGESFRPPSEFLHGSSVEPVALAFLDANGDGRQDVCFGAREGNVYTFLGDGRFLDDAKSAVRIEPAFAGPGLESIFAAALDRDGKDEIIASTEVPGLVILSDRRPEGE